MRPTDNHNQDFPVPLGEFDGYVASTSNAGHSGLYGNLCVPGLEAPLAQLPLQQTAFGNVTHFPSLDCAVDFPLPSWTSQTIASLSIPPSYNESSTRREVSFDFAAQNLWSSHWSGEELITCPAIGQSVAQLQPSSQMGSRHDSSYLKQQGVPTYLDSSVPATQPLAHGQYTTDRNEVLSSHQIQLFSGQVPAATGCPWGKLLPSDQIDRTDGSRSHYQCRWTENGVTCGVTLTGGKRDILLHLYERHNIKYGSEKLLQRCHWFQCRKTMKRESIPRHIVAVHIKEGVRCPDCGSTFSREDALKRHQRGARQKASQGPEMHQPEAGSYGRICARNTMHME